MTDEFPVLMNAVYPFDLMDRLKKGEYDLDKLIEDGMVIGFNCFTPIDREIVMKEYPREILPDGVIFLDLEEFKKEFERVCKFTRECKVIEPPLLLWLFRNIFFLSKLFSKKKNEELEKLEEKGDYGNPMTIFNYEVNIKYKGKDNETWNMKRDSIFFSTHQYLTKPYFVDRLVDYNEKRMEDVIKNLHKKEKKENKRKPINNTLRHEVFKRDNYTCVECGATKEKKTLHTDHIIPVSQGGTDELDNLQTLCDDCNISKSNRKW